MVAVFNNQLSNNLEKFTLGSSGLVSTASGTLLVLFPVVKPQFSGYLSQPWRKVWCG